MSGPRRKTGLPALLAAGWLCGLAPAFGQASDGGSGAAKAADAPSERLQRMADNPLRVILEAGRIKRRPDGAEPVVDTAEPRRAAPAAAAAPAAPVPRPPAEARLLSERLVAAPPAAAPAAPLAPELRPVVWNPSAALSGPAPAPLPQPSAVMRPRLLSMVEPDFPARLQDTVARLGEVAVDVEIGTDGRVAAATLLAPAPRAIERFVLEAVQQWRFEPPPRPSTFRYQLVFNPGR